MIVVSMDKRTRLLGLVTAASLLVSSGSSSMAGWMADRYLDIDKILRTMPKVAIPLQDHFDITTGQKVSDQAIRAFLNGPAQSAATIVVKNGSDQETYEPGNLFDRVGLEFESGTEQIEFIFKIENGSSDLFRSTDPILSLSMPLAEAIREVRDRFSAQAQPIPQDLASYFSAIIPRKLLQRVRYAVGDVKLLMPHDIAQSGTMFIEDHAVVADDIIVFSREPDLDNREDIKWWAHELQHAYQYMNWGVDFFAYRYVKHANRVESEADQASSYVDSFGAQLGGSDPVEPKVSFSDVLHATSVNLTTPLGKTTIFQKSGLENFPDALNRIEHSMLCIINGDYLVITKSGIALSITQNGAVAGTRMRSRSPVNCRFDIRPNGSDERLCVQRRSGLIFPDNPPFHVGQCQECTSQPCF